MDDITRLHPIVEKFRANRLRSVKGRDYSMTLGAYEDPGGRMARARARCLFWDAFDQEAPDALPLLFDNADAIELETDLSSGTQVFWPTERTQHHVHNWGVRYHLWEAQSPEGEKPGHREICADLLVALRDRAIGLATRDSGVECLCQVAARASFWAPHHPVAGGFQGQDPRISILSDFTEPLNIRQFTADGSAIFAWNPLIETEEAARRRLSIAFEEQLTAAMDRRKREAEARGLVPVETDNGTKRTTEHFRWLVRYQCLGQTYDLIARATQRDRKTIRDGILSAARLVSVRLRPPRQRGGRRRKGRAASTVWTKSYGG